MKHLILLYLVISSCNNGGKETKLEANTNHPPIGATKIIAVYIDLNGNKTPGVIGRVIDKVIKYDSVNKKDFITYDTAYGIERQVPERDSLNRVIIDSLTNKPKMIWVWAKIGKDSVNTHIENIPLDSLLKK